MRVVVVGLVLLASVAGCRGKPRPVYEYEPPVTITSTDAPVPADASAPAEASAPAIPTTTLPSRPSPWRKGGTR